MAKPNVLAVGAGGQDVADLDRGIGDDHAVDQQQHELTALLEAGLGQSTLHPLAARSFASVASSMRPFRPFGQASLDYAAE